MRIKSSWNKYDLIFKMIVIFFLLSLFFLVFGVIILATIRINVIFSGFNLIHYFGIIGSLQYYEVNNFLSIVFLKIGIIFTFFLMPIMFGCSMILFIIKIFFRKENKHGKRTSFF